MSISTLTSVLAMGVSLTSEENSGTAHVSVCRVQAMMDSDDHEAEERTPETWVRLSHILLEIRPCLHHLPSFCKLPKHLVPQFPHLDKDRSFFPGKELILLRH